MPEPHPLAAVIADALAGRFLPVDGGWHRVPPWQEGVEAVLAFTGHAVLAVGDDVPDERLNRLGVDGFGGAHHPRVLLDLAGPDGWIDSLDALLARRGAEPGPPLVARPDLAGHPRAGFARALRTDVRVLGYPDERRHSIATVSRGIAGLAELSVEHDPTGRGTGAGSAFVRAAVASADADLVVAAVAPGNVASLRAFLGAGFEIVGSVQMVRPSRPPVRPVG